MAASYTVLPDEATTREESTPPIEEKKATTALTNEEIAAQLEEIFANLITTQPNDALAQQESDLGVLQEHWFLQTSISKNLKKQIEDISRPLTLEAAKEELEYLYNFYREREEILATPLDAAISNTACGGLLASSALIFAALSCCLWAPSSSVAASLCLPTCGAGLGTIVTSACMMPVGRSPEKINLFRLQLALEEIRKLENQLALQATSSLLVSTQAPMFLFSSSRNASMVSIASMASMPALPTPNPSPTAQQR